MIVPKVALCAGWARLNKDWMPCSSMRVISRARRLCHGTPRYSGIQLSLLNGFAAIALAQANGLEDRFGRFQEKPSCVRNFNFSPS